MKSAHIRILVICFLLGLFIPNITFAETKPIKGRDAIEWFKMGDQVRDSGRWKEALDAYSSALDINPKYVEAYINRGTIYYVLKNDKQAISDLDKAIKLDPNYIMSLQYTSSDNTPTYKRKINFYVFKMDHYCPVNSRIKIAGYSFVL